jgi:Tol biopolymer transport system component
MPARALVRLLLLGILASSIIVAAGGTSASSDITTRVSVDSLGNQADGLSLMASLSGDGRYVAFESDAANLVPGDTNGDKDIFVHDRQTGETTRVSVDSAGNQANAFSARPRISADGRYVVFAAVATNLVPGGSRGDWQIFVHDRQTGLTTQASVDSNGNPGNSWTPLFDYPAAISAEGRYVAFVSMSSNLVPGDTNLCMIPLGPCPDVFVYDLQTGETTRVSVDSAGNQANTASGLHSIAISADGRFVFFDSAANLVPEATYGGLYVHDRLTGETTLGGGGAVSADGRYVAFTSQIGQIMNVFVRDRSTDGTEVVSVSNNGESGNAASSYPSISADGRYVAFYSWASNLVPGDNNDWADIFVHDRLTGETTRASVNSDGNEGSSYSEFPSISGDGHFVAFDSPSSNLVPGDTNGQRDIFLHDLTAVEPTPTPTLTPTLSPTSTPTATHTLLPPTPTSTPTKSPRVGGVVNLPPAAVAAESGAPSGDSRWSVGAWATLVGGIAVAGVAISVGGWRIRRRRLR